MRRQFKYKPVSADGLHWSQDNQIAFCTHDAIFIINPTEKLSSTQILSQKFKPRRFWLENDHNNLDHIRSSQTLSDSFMSICWSPTGLSSLGGCMLLSISAHHYVQVYAPVDDPKSGSWTKVLDLTKTIEDLSREDQIQIDQLQSTCGSWSYMLPGGKSCIASVGDKSGRIIFFIISENKVLKTFSVQVGSTWLSKCAWADWKENGQEIFTYFSTASVDGTVKIWKISFYNDQIKAELLQQVCEPDKLLVTALSFNNGMEFPKLAFSKGYSLYSCSINPDLTVSSIRLPCFMNICSIIWSTFDSSLRVYTFDGNCFILANDKSDSLVLMDDDSSGLRNAIIKTGSDSLEPEDGEEKPEEDDEEPDQVVVYGASSSFNSLYDCILFTSTKTYDVNYKTLVDESCSVLIRPLVDSNDEMIIEDIKHCFDSPIKILNPIYNLWDVYELFKSSDSTILSDIQNQLLEESRGILSSDLDNIQNNLSSFHFKAHKLASYLSLLRTGKVDFIFYTESIMFYIKYFLSILKSSDSLTPTDIKTISMINSLYLLNSNDWTDLLTELIKFYTFLSKNQSTQRMAEDLLFSLKQNSNPNSSQEECIVCQSEIPILEVGSGTCINGHDWTRCSQCFKCIQSFSYRECIGCNAKACISDSIKLNYCMICGCRFRLVGIGFSIVS